MHLCPVVVAQGWSIGASSNYKIYTLLKVIGCVYFKGYLAIEVLRGWFNINCPPIMNSYVLSFSIIDYVFSGYTSRNFQIVLFIIERKTRMTTSINREAFERNQNAKE